MNWKRSHLVAGLITCAVCIVVVLFIAYSSRFALLDSRYQLLQSIGVHCLLAGGDLKGLDKPGVTSKLGHPDYKSDRYALLLLRDGPFTGGPTADLLVRLNVSNQVTDLGFAWMDYAPTKTNLFDQRAWRMSTVSGRMLMSADLIVRWHDNEVDGSLKTLADIDTILGPVFFVDEWQYRIGDWRALVLEFDPSGVVTNARAGYYD